MKKIITLLFMTISLSINAIQFSVMGPCSDSPLLSVSRPVEAGEFVSDITLNIFAKYEVNYIGDNSSIEAIFDISGAGVYETSRENSEFDNNQMRVYGWCYSVNGKASTLLPNEFKVKNSDHIKWFYGYIFYDHGVWAEMCQPAYKIKPYFICN